MAETMRGYNESVSPITDITVAFGLVFAKAKPELGKLGVEVVENIGSRIDLMN
jgi:hypothetical protein